MNLNELDTAFRMYKPAAIIAAEDITLGLANSSYLLTTDAGEHYVLRQLRIQSPDNARAEARIQQLVRDAGVTTPQYVRLRNGDVVGSLGDIHFTISPYIYGSQPSDLNLKLAASFGATLARIHNGLAGQQELVPAGSAQWLLAQNVEREIAACPEQLADVLRQVFATVRHLPAKDLPRAVIHGDLMPDNTFAQDDSITAVFDFETAEYTVRLLDVARTYISFAYAGELDPEALRSAILLGYDDAARQKLTAAETDDFPVAVTYVAIAAAAWLRNNGGEAYVRPYLAVAGIDAPAV